jgi:anaerobic selenocysteine-containing dehydrogenase
MHRDWVRSSRARVIAIDPIAHETARQADLHLQLRPGTDAALAFGLLHIIKKADRFDHHFIDRHVLGFERVQPDIDAATPEITEQWTGVPAALIERAALQFSEGPSLLWLGQGMQRQPRGGNAFRASVLLSVVTGYLGKQRAGFCYMNGPETRGVDYSFLMAPDLRKDGGASISHLDLADYLESAEKSRALFTWNNNILASSPAQSRLRKAIAREDLFTVVTDLFMTDTAMFADYILPAASFLEFDDLIFPYFHNTMSAQVKAIEPVGQALPNQEIFRRLARAMGYNAKELCESDESMLSRLIAQTSFKGSFADLKALGTVALLKKPLVQFEDLHFNTPSGRIEVYSQRMEDLGQPPVPVPHADPVPIGDSLRVLSPASAWLLNSIHGNAEAVRNRMGDPTVYLSAAEAARRGLAEGDAVVLKNAAGSLHLKMQISSNVPNGVALVYKGNWPRHTDEAANVNVLNPGLRSDIADSTAVHGVEALLLRA